MKRVIPNWRHQPGRHCASTALRDTLDFSGLCLSEAMCFGLGRGIGAFYLADTGFSPSKWLMTRCADLEGKALSALGVPFAWRTAPDADTAWAETRAAVAAGIPALLQTDIRHLDYFNSRTHFNRHAVVLWGFDEEAGVGYLTDTEREGLIEVPLASLSRARNSPLPPGPVQFDWFPVERPAREPDLRAAARAAIRLNALDLSTVENNFPLGLNGLAALAADLPCWPDAPDWKWCARFCYQAIEKRGTGGSGFRAMYAEFLAEAEALDPTVRGLGLADRMREIAARWTELSSRLKAISDQDAPDGFDAAARSARAILEAERDYCAAAATVSASTASPL